MRILFKGISKKLKQKFPQVGVSADLTKHFLWLVEFFEISSILNSSYLFVATPN